MKMLKRMRKARAGTDRKKQDTLFWRLEQLELDPDAAHWRQAHHLL